jgi:hypothetical protein
MATVTTYSVISLRPSLLNFKNDVNNKRAIESLHWHMVISALQETSTELFWFIIKFRFGKQRDAI